MPNLNEKFRIPSEISKIKGNCSPPAIYSGCLTSDEIQWLNSMHNNISKTWMNDAYRTSFKKNDNKANLEFYNAIETWAINKFTPILHNFNISSFFFYESPTPVSATDSTIHADLWDDETFVFKTILIPLEITPTIKTHTVIFDQHYYHFGAAYAGKVGNKKIFGPNAILPKNYSMIEDLNILTDFDKEIYFSHLTHKSYANFYGLTVNKIIEWSIGDAIIFDRTQLHCCDHYFNINKRAWFAIWTNRG